MASTFRIADTFTAALAKLSAPEQRAVKATAFDLQMGAGTYGDRMHRVDSAKDPNFWSVRVNDDIRVILHRNGADTLLAYVDHHDKAYRWAERRRIEQHPTTGAMQLVEIRERVEELPLPKPAAPSSGPRPFSALRKLELMALGVPEDWVEDVRAATEDALFDVLTHLPEEAQEALLCLAVGERPQPVVHSDMQPVFFGSAQLSAIDPFKHPDAQRRFRVLNDIEELRRALDFPWDRWAVFLHPAQRALVERRYAGPARVTGSAGTGKTVVALHRAAHLARINPAARVLLATFSKPLARALAGRLSSLVATEPSVAGRITVHSLTGAAYDLHAKLFGPPNIASPTIVEAQLRKLAQASGVQVPLRFLIGEWEDVVDAQQLRSWDAYRDAPRLGRKTRLGEKQRQALWAVFEAVQAALAAQKLVTWSEVFTRLAGHAAWGAALGFDYAVVDEAQDLSTAEARFLAAVFAGKPNGLFLAGDIGQRIFQQPFSWKSVGIDVRGRSHSLRINYRTSHQIRMQADRLLPGKVSDVDGLEEGRRGTVSLFEGPSPTVSVHDSEAAENARAGEWIAARLKEGCPPHEIGLLVRSPAQLPRARAAAKAAGAKATEFDEKVATVTGALSIGVMHMAKGLEFRAVAVMACDDEVLPLQERVEAVRDEADLEEVYETERHLLYVACTRARDHLWVSGVKPASEFLTDLAV